MRSDVAVHLGDQRREVLLDRLELAQIEPRASEVVAFGHRTGDLVAWNSRAFADGAAELLARLDESSEIHQRGTQHAARLHDLDGRRRAASLDGGQRIGHRDDCFLRVTFMHVDPGQLLEQRQLPPMARPEMPGRESEAARNQPPISWCNRARTAGSPCSSVSSRFEPRSSSSRALGSRPRAFSGSLAVKRLTRKSWTACARRAY
jgi:hypothetical protein